MTSWVQGLGEILGAGIAWVAEEFVVPLQWVAAGEVGRVLLWTAYQVRYLLPLLLFAWFWRVVMLGAVLWRLGWRPEWALIPWLSRCIFARAVGRRWVEGLYGVLRWLLLICTAVCGNLVLQLLAASVMVGISWAEQVVWRRHWVVALQQLGWRSPPDGSKVILSRRFAVWILGPVPERSRLGPDLKTAHAQGVRAGLPEGFAHRRAPGEGREQG